MNIFQKISIPTIDKKESFFISLVFFIISPIFIYFYDSQVHFEACYSIELCAALNFGTIILLIISMFFLIINKFLFLFSIFIFFFLLEFLFFNDIIILLRALKSLLPFFFLFCFMQIKQEANFNKKFLKFVLNKFIPYFVIFFQIVFIFSNLNFFYADWETNGEIANFFFKNITVYNYSQYFSFVLVISCGVRLFVSTKKKEIFFLIFIMIIGSIHASNNTAIVCSVLISCIFFLSKKSFLKNNFKIISDLFLLLLILTPFFSFVLLFMNLEFINNFAQLQTRLVRYDLVLSQLEAINFFYGIYPGPFFTQQPHNQILEYIMFFGILRAFFLIGLIIYMIKKISKIEYLIPLSVTIGLAGSLNELFTHTYTGQILFLYICFASSVWEKKLT